MRLEPCGFIICKKERKGAGHYFGRALSINHQMNHQKEHHCPCDPKFVPAMADFFRVLGDPTRIRLIAILHEQETCVTELAERLRMTQSAVSHQLNILKAHKIVAQRRVGRQIFYSLPGQNIWPIIETGLSHLAEK